MRLFKDVVQRAAEEDEAAFAEKSTGITGTNVISEG